MGEMLGGAFGNIENNWVKRRQKKRERKGILEPTG